MLIDYVKTWKLIYTWRGSIQLQLEQNKSLEWVKLPRIIGIEQDRSKWSTKDCVPAASFCSPKDTVVFYFLWGPWSWMCHLVLAVME